MIPLPPGQWDRMAPLLTECFLQLFAFYGAAAELVPGSDPGPRSDRDELASFVGLFGPHARGALLTVTSMPLLIATHPMAALGQPIDECMAQDWHNELSNQLAGRLKTKLTPHGIGDLRLTPPKCLIGAGMRGFSRDHDRALAFRAMGVPVQVVLELYVDETLDLGRVVAPDEAQVAEGEFLLF
jgi:CheY-specific phosphatase CheX